MTNGGGHKLRRAVGWRWRHFLPLLCLLLLASPARGEEDELRSLELYNGTQSETVSVGRSPRPASQTAENITVVTAKDIEALNAHTLVDVLNLVAGVQVEYLRTAGSTTMVDLQGSNYNHILVLIDNVPINNLADNFPDIAIPVQMIERVEIVKGAASSSWGNALGGVINVITKSPQPDREIGGLVSASAGKASTVDGRGEFSGTSGGFGYYLTGGKLRSDGLSPNNRVDLNHFYGKLHYDLPGQGSLTLTSAYSDVSRAELQVPQMDLNRNTDLDQLIATFTAQYPLTDRISLDATYRTRRMNSDLLYFAISSGGLLRDVRDEEVSNGSVVKLTYLDNLQRVVAGVDYDHLKAHLSQPQTRADYLVSSDDRVGVYLNDTFTINRFAITPSIRYDHSSISGDLFSPSFGLTYALTDNTVLRGYTAKGYSITSLNRANSLEKVWTSQVGIESADIGYLWLKGTLFRNETWDITVDNPDNSHSMQRQLKRGVELEARTLPVLSTSLSVGYTYVDAEVDGTGAAVTGIARHTLNVGVKYEDSRNFRAQVTGHYIDWITDPSAQPEKDMIWDLHLAKKVIYTDQVAVEFFGSLRNLFNGDQYNHYFYKNPRRWGEVGIRCQF
ncbi:TonB-dependent receptor [Geomonas sp. Red32]|uniref:TonB-dependent receptor plug domain-containing protein n=1 Tax=Geomonas sp. Red32 TaxID=2912856 RepID=UPI00202CF460|nr:TonB-dependent receptor [Geomonas sp. Red32]